MEQDVDFNLIFEIMHKQQRFDERPSNQNLKPLKSVATESKQSSMPNNEDEFHIMHDFDENTEPEQSGSPRARRKPKLLHPKRTLPPRTPQKTQLTDYDVSIITPPDNTRKPRPLLKFSTPFATTTPARTHQVPEEGSARRKRSRHPMNDPIFEQPTPGSLQEVTQSTPGDRDVMEVLSHAQPQARRKLLSDIKSEPGPTGHARAPAPRLQPPSAVPEGYVPVTHLPHEYRSVFPYPHFNRVQSECFDMVHNSDSNMVVGAPTGSGKTVLFELAIVRMLRSNLRSQGRGKAIYVAPLKALCNERVADWSKKFAHLNVRVAELTGDVAFSRMGDMKDADIIVTTPEKWDSSTRNWTNSLSVIRELSLMLIDEVHLLHEERGATLEAVVSRMKTLASSDRTQDTRSAAMRFLAVSATIPNIKDVAEWLLVPPEGLRYFGDEYRPVKLERYVKAYPYRKNANGRDNTYTFLSSLDYRLPDVISGYSAGKPALVFCATRNGCSQTAGRLTQELQQRGTPLVKPRSQQAQFLSRIAEGIPDAKLAASVRLGAGWHSAGLEMSARRQIEQAFISGQLPVLCTTTTLAQGVNLPAYLCVIKGTKFYRAGEGWVEYGQIMISQMLGRAGRPQFDTSGVCVIMTGSDTAQRYQQLVSTGEMIVESRLFDKIKEHLNSEIVLGTITSIDSAMTWLRSTFLYVRIFKNPQQYGFPPGMTHAELEKSISNIITINLRSLSNCGMIELDNSTSQLHALELGQFMSRYYIAFDTILAFKKMLQPFSNLRDVLEVTAAASELAGMTPRNDQKKYLNLLNEKKNRFRIKSKIKDAAMKCNVLIQATLQGEPIEQYELRNNTIEIMRTATRVLACLTEFCLLNRYCVAAINAAILKKCVALRMWENSPLISKQLERIGDQSAKALAAAGMSSLQSIIKSGPRNIEMILSRNSPFGDRVIDAARDIPQFRVALSQIGPPRTGTADVSIEVTLASDPDRAKGWFRVMVGTREGLSSERKCRVQEAAHGSIVMRVQVDEPAGADKRVVAAALTDRSCGGDAVAVIAAQYAAGPNHSTTAQPRQAAPASHVAEPGSGMPDFNPPEPKKKAKRVSKKAAAAAAKAPRKHSTAGLETRSAPVVQESAEYGSNPYADPPPSNVAPSTGLLGSAQFPNGDTPEAANPPSSARRKRTTQGGTGICEAQSMHPLASDSSIAAAPPDPRPLLKQRRSNASKQLQQVTQAAGGLPQTPVKLLKQGRSLPSSISPLSKLGYQKSPASQAPSPHASQAPPYASQTQYGQPTSGAGNPGTPAFSLPQQPSSMPYIPPQGPMQPQQPYAQPQPHGNVPAPAPRYNPYLSAVHMRAPGPLQVSQPPPHQPPPNQGGMFTFSTPLVTRNPTQTQVNSAMRVAPLAPYAAALSHNIGTGNSKEPNYGPAVPPQNQYRPPEQRQQSFFNFKI